MGAGAKARRRALQKGIQQKHEDRYEKKRGRKDESPHRLATTSKALAAEAIS